LYVETVPMFQHIFYLPLHTRPYSHCGTYIYRLFPPALFTLKMKIAKYAKTQEAQTYDGNEPQKPEETY
jgi:hypothetical protein